MDFMIFIFTILVATILLLLVLWSRNGHRNSRTTQQPVESDIVSEVATIRERSVGTRRMRHRHPTSASTSSSLAISEYNEEQEDEEEEEEEVFDASYYTAKTNRKKHEKKLQKESRKQAEAAARDSRREKMDKQAGLRRQKDEAREAEELRKEEAVKAQKVKEEAAANALFDKWKESFSVENEGTNEIDVEGGSQGLLNDFVQYIKNHKCVALEDLAGEFNLRTQDCINRVLALEQMGRISGVMDDRGKFIYISPEEMKAVADYIKRLGRVSIAHLASKSNEFIDLELKSFASDLASEKNDPFLESNITPILVA